jgi:hypothetical protein
MFIHRNAAGLFVGTVIPMTSVSHILISASWRRGFCGVSTSSLRVESNLLKFSSWRNWKLPRPSSNWNPNGRSTPGCLVHVDHTNLLMMQSPADCTLMNQPISAFLWSNVLSGVSENFGSQLHTRRAKLIDWNVYNWLHIAESFFRALTEMFITDFI